MVESNKASVKIEFVDISLWALPLTVQQRVKLSSIIELERERTAWQNTDAACPRVLCSRCRSGRTNQAAIPWRGGSGQVEENRCRLMANAGRTSTHSVTLKVSGTIIHLVDQSTVDKSSDNLYFCQQIPREDQIQQ